MSVLHPDGAKALKLPGRNIKFVVTQKTCGIKNMNGGITEIGVKSQLPEHSHNSQEEAMYFIKGKGEAVLNGEGANVNPGDIFYVPAGEIHTVRNIGSEALVFFFLFSPQIDTSSYEKQDIS